MQNIEVIINPAAGKDAPILNTLNRVFREHAVSWQASITHDSGDARKLAQEAAGRGADAVAGYGGDGTLMEIANGLIDSGVPLAILPGGTGNGIAKELGIPADLKQAAELICSEHTIRHIDLGRLDSRYFLLHAYVGLKSSQRASRELKDRFGILAYALAILRVMTNPVMSHYSLSVDGQEFEEDGIVCMVTNAAGLGLNLPVIGDISPRNGLLNLFVITGDALALVKKAIRPADIGAVVKSWQGREIGVDAQPAQTVWIDGEAADSTPCTINVAPQALPVVTP